MSVHLWIYAELWYRMVCIWTSHFLLTLATSEGCRVFKNLFLWTIQVDTKDIYKMHGKSKEWLSVHVSTCEYKPWGLTASTTVTCVCPSSQLILTPLSGCPFVAITPGFLLRFYTYTCISKRYEWNHPCSFLCTYFSLHVVFLRLVPVVCSDARFPHSHFFVHYFFLTLRSSQFSFA